MTSLAIFGATSAIAERVARLYAESGASLYLVARDATKLKLVADDLRARGAALVVERAFDFAAIDAFPNLLAEMQAKYGIPDRALIAFGTLPVQAEIQDDEAEARQALEVNFLSPALLLQALARLMAAAGGAIAVIGSVAGDRGRASNYIYGSAKAALGTFAQGLAHRQAAAPGGKPLAIVLVKPGFVDTPMTAAFPKGGPLWAKPEAVAGDIHAALERNRSTILYTPFFWRYILIIIRLLPQAIMHRTKL
jgi:short-subunit dehydrogenase